MQESSILRNDARLITCPAVWLRAGVQHAAGTLSPFGPECLTMYSAWYGGGRGTVHVDLVPLEDAETCLEGVGGVVWTSRTCESAGDARDGVVGSLSALPLY